LKKSTGLEEMTILEMCWKRRTKPLEFVHSL